MTVVRLAERKLVLHSPTRLTADLRAEIEALGTVRAVIEPSWWHDLYLAEYTAAYPAAELFGARTLVRWARSLKFTHVLSEDAPALWKADLEQRQVEGIGLFLDEVAFCHRPSRSLILADLLFNFSEHDAAIV
jgi:hypothetical protein